MGLDETKLNKNNTKAGADFMSAPTFIKDKQGRKMGEFISHISPDDHQDKQGREMSEFISHISLDDHREAVPKGETNMDYDIKNVSARLKGTREYLDISAAELAKKTKTTIDEYHALENGERDFSLSFLNDCAAALGIELIELMTGKTPNLKKYSLARNGKGLPIKRRENFLYQHMAHVFKNKKAEPFMVTAPFSDADQSKPIALSSHEGQEMDLIISGKLKFVIEGHTEILEEGDCIYFDAKNPHGMIAIEGQDCKFLAVLMS